MTKDEAFVRLGKSTFRSRFKLTTEDRAYIDRVGLATIRRHARAAQGADAGGRVED